MKNKNFPPVRRLDIQKWEGQALPYLNEKPFFWWEAGAVGIDFPAGDAFDKQKANDTVYQRSEKLNCNVMELVGIAPRALESEDCFESIFKQIDNSIEKVINTNAYVFMRIELDNLLPDWYKGAFLVDQNGMVATYDVHESRASIHDPYFLEYGCEFISKIVTHYQSHPYVLGYTPVFGCCNQCSYPNFGWFDFSDMAITQFRVWLKKQYKTVSDFNQSWEGQVYSFDHVTFDDVRKLDLNASKSVLARDFKRFRRDSLHHVYSTLIEQVSSSKGVNQLTGAFCELVAGGPGHLRGEDPAGYQTTSAQVFKSAAGYTNPMPWEWPGVPDKEWLGAIDNAPNWICATPYLKDRVHLAELSYGNHEPRSFETQCAGATSTLFDSLREPALFSFFVLPNYNEQIFELLVPQVEFLQRFHSIYWGRDSRVGLLVDMQRYLLDDRSGVLETSEHMLRLSRNLFKLGVCHDLVYDTFVNERLSSGEYDVLLVPEWCHDSVKGLETTTEVIPISDLSIEPLKTSLKALGIPLAHHDGLESIRINDKAWVGRAGIADKGPVFVPLSAPGKIHARRVRGHDLTWTDHAVERGTSRSGEQGIWVTEPFEVHDLQFVFITPIS